MGSSWGGLESGLWKVKAKQLLVPSLPDLLRFSNLLSQNPSVAMLSCHDGQDPFKAFTKRPFLP